MEKIIGALTNGVLFVVVGTNIGIERSDPRYWIVLMAICLIWLNGATAMKND